MIIFPTIFIQLQRNGHALPAAEPELAEEEAAVGDRWCGWSVSDRVALGGCLLNVTTKVTDMRIDLPIPIRNC